MFYLVEIVDDRPYRLVDTYDNFEYALINLKKLESVYSDCVFEIMDDISSFDID